MRSIVGLPRDAARSIDIQDGKTKFRVEAGQRILCNLVSSLQSACSSGPEVS
jgi:hypothetical protein